MQAAPQPAGVPIGPFGHLRNIGRQRACGVGLWAPDKFRLADTLARALDESTLKYLLKHVRDWPPPCQRPPPPPPPPLCRLQPAPPQYPCPTACTHAESHQQQQQAVMAAREPVGWTLPDQLQLVWNTPTSLYYNTLGVLLQHVRAPPSFLLGWRAWKPQPAFTAGAAVAACRCRLPLPLPPPAGACCCLNPLHGHPCAGHHQGYGRSRRQGTPATAVAGRRQVGMRV